MSDETRRAIEAIRREQFERAWELLQMMCNNVQPPLEGCRLDG